MSSIEDYYEELVIQVLGDGSAAGVIQIGRSSRADEVDSYYLSLEILREPADEPGFTEMEEAFFAAGEELERQAS